MEMKFLTNLNNMEIVLKVIIFLKKGIQVLVNDSKSFNLKLDLILLRIEQEE